MGRSTYGKIEAVEVEAEEENEGKPVSGDPPGNKPLEETELSDNSENNVENLVQ